MRRKGIGVIFTVLLSLLASRAMGACAFAPIESNPANSIQKFTVPLAVNTLSVPPGAVIGSVIYQQDIRVTNNAELIRIRCDTSGQFLITQTYKLTPQAETSTGSKIYKTGIQGIGVKFTYLNGAAKVFPYTYQLAGTCTNATICRISLFGANTSIQFIKTDDVVSSGTIYTNNLPTALYQIGQSGNMVDVYEINFSGSLTVNTPTCDISPVSQSMTVQMGKHDISVFSGKDSGTEWKDASIQLQSCGWFHGNSSSSIATFDGTNNIDIKSLTQNRAEVMLWPLDGIDSANDGIISLADHPLKAAGIGIQLSSSESSSGKINLDAAYKYNLPNDGSQNITIPLFARYIQTGNSVSAGKADGKMVFTVNYQ